MKFDPQSNIIVRDGDTALASGKPQGEGGGRWGQIVAAVTLVGVIGVGVAAWSFLGPRMASAAEAPTSMATVIGEIRPAPTEASPITIEEEASTLEQLDGVRYATNHLLLMREADRLLARGRHSEAIPLLEEVVDIRPHHDEARYKLGLAYARIGNQDGLRLQRVALSDLDPNLSNLLGNLVR